MNMGIQRTTRAWAGALACASLLAVTAAAHAQQASTPAANTPEQEMKQAWAAAEAAAQRGPIAVPLRDQATLKVGANQIFIPQPAAGQLMHAMGNGDDTDTLGLILPTGDAEWVIEAKYEAAGYIKDDDARDWNVDDLYKSLKEGTAAANEEREKRGIPALEIQGWVERPHYDAATHRLIWSMAARRAAPPGATPLHARRPRCGRSRAPHTTARPAR